MVGDAGGSRAAGRPEGVSWKVGCPALHRVVWWPEWGHWGERLAGYGLWAWLAGCVMCRFTAACGTGVQGL
jgi:hypothetical protein